MLEQAIAKYCNASLDKEKEALLIEIKKHSTRLTLLELFYCQKGDQTCAVELQKLCSVLDHESYQENEEELISLLSKIYQLIAQLPISTY